MNRRQARATTYSGHIVATAAAALVAASAGSAIAASRTAAASAETSAARTTAAAWTTAAWSARVPSGFAADPAPLFLPIAPAVGPWSAPEQLATATALPTDQSSETPTPATSPTATSAPPAADVVIQIADFGGLPSAPYFQERIRYAPWITIYEDGAYVRSADLSVHDPVGGLLTPAQLRAVLDRLVVDGAFFQYPASDGMFFCATDGSSTRTFVRDGGRDHLVTSYLMLWLGMYPDRCPPGSPGMPAGPETDAFLALARQVASLNTPLSATEEMYRIEHGTVFVESAPPGHAEVPWPLAMSISSAAGTDTLSPSEYATLAAAIGRHKEYEWNEYAVFRDSSGASEVGLRVEVPGWNTYCQGESHCGS